MSREAKLQQFLAWLNQKSNSIKTSYTQFAIRGFYLELILDFNPIRDSSSSILDFARTLDYSQRSNAAKKHNVEISIIDDWIIARDFPLTDTLDSNLAHHAVAMTSDSKRNSVRILASTLAKTLDLSDNKEITSDNKEIICALSLGSNLIFTRIYALALTLTLILNLDFNLEISGLQHILDELYHQVPDSSLENQENFKQWWQLSSQAWVGQLREVMTKYFDIGHDWKFDSEQKQLILLYYDANKLLVDCLGVANVSSEVAEQVKDTLLLPIAEIEKRKREKME